MAAGDVTVSGAYVVSDTTAIDGFETAYTSSGGGNSVFVIPSGGNTVYIGCVEGI